MAYVVRPEFVCWLTNEHTRIQKTAIFFSTLGALPPVPPKLNFGPHRRRCQLPTTTVDAANYPSHLASTIVVPIGLARRCAQPHVSTLLGLAHHRLLGPPLTHLASCARTA
jgi:hypothetical protein